MAARLFEQLRTVEVGNSPPQYVRVVSEQAERSVAVVAESAPDAACLMVMIDAHQARDAARGLLFRLVADSASVVLSVKDRLIVRYGQAVLLAQATFERVVPLPLAILRLPGARDRTRAVLAVTLESGCAPTAAEEIALRLDGLASATPSLAELNGGRSTTQSAMSEHIRDWLAFHPAGLRSIPTGNPCRPSAATSATSVRDWLKEQLSRLHGIPPCQLYCTSAVRW